MTAENKHGSATSTPGAPREVWGGWDVGFAKFAYRWRWALSALMLAMVVALFGAGGSRIGWFTGAIASLEDATPGTGKPQPLVFDPRLDVWFGREDDAVDTYYEIEDRFVGEDYVMVSFEETGDPFGVFGRESMATVARLTESFLTIPGVRHVRSLTYNPWIRWGTIEDELGSEEGLIISDLVEGDPRELTDDDIITRMVAVLGAENTAARIGEDRVRAVLGPDADFSDHIGEPLLLGTIVDDAGTTTAIQVQVLRPRVDYEALELAVDGDTDALATAPTLFQKQIQRTVLRGIEHFLRVESGYAVPTPELVGLEAWVASIEDEGERAAQLVELRDPRKNFMRDGEGELVRKYYEYKLEDGELVDRSDPAAPLVASSTGFTPQPLSGYEYHVGGVPVFERNFEEVGMADAVYSALVFLVLALCLFAVFRNVVGVVAPLAIVFGSVAAMVGTGFAIGDLFNNLTIMAPNMLTAVGIADAVHLVAAWAFLRSRYDDKRELLVEVVRTNALPVLLTSITTAVGFFSLTVSELAPVTMLGYSAGLGTLFAYLLSMTFVPAMLSLVPHRKTKESKEQLAAWFTEERSHAIVHRVVTNRVPILAAGVVLVVVASVGVARLVIDSDFRAMFPDDNPAMSDFGWIEDRMGGVGDLEIVFEGVGPAGGVAAPELTEDEETRLSELQLAHAGAVEAPDDFTPLSGDERAELTLLEAKAAAWDAARIGVSTEFLGALDEFEARLRREMAEPGSELAIITDLVSPLDILRKMHQVQHENSASWYRVPGEADVPAELRQAQLEYDDLFEEWSLVPAQDGKSLVAQYYLQYENGARPGENLTTQLSADRTQLRMQGRILQASSLEQLAALQRIEEVAAEEFPYLDVNSGFRPEESGVPANGMSDMTVSGITLLSARTMDLFSVGFLKSMGIALAAITILIGLIFRSWRLALISLLPNFLPIVLPLSAFGLLGIPLHGPAILVSSVALGVCVDDTIHFFTKYVRALGKGQSNEEAMAYVLHHSGAAITITTVLLMLGFSTLLVSDFTPNFMMGALATVMIGLAWVADFILTPAALSLWGAPAGARDEAVSPARPRAAALAS